MLRAVSAAALVAVAGAKANEYVVASSVPEPVDGDLISFQHVTHKSAVIHWLEPGLGKWRLPIDGYRIKLRTTRNFPREAAATHKVRRDAHMPRAVLHADAQHCCAASQHFCRIRGPAVLCATSHLADIAAVSIITSIAILLVLLLLPYGSCWRR